MEIKAAASLASDLATKELDSLDKQIEVIVRSARDPGHRPNRRPINKWESSSGSNSLESAAAEVDQSEADRG